MSIFIGGAEASKVFVGGAEASKVFAGGAQIWPSAAVGFSLSLTVTNNVSNTNASGSSFNIPSGMSIDVYVNADTDYDLSASAITLTETNGGNHFSATQEYDSDNDRVKVTITVGTLTANQTGTLTLSGSATATNYVGNISVTGPANTTVSNLTPVSYSGNAGDNVNITYTLTAASGYVFSDNSTVKNNIAGSVTIPSGGGDVTYTDTTNTVSETFTVTLSMTDNVGGANAVLSKLSVTGGVGYEEDVNLTVTTSSNNRYFTTYPTINGNDNFVIKSTSDSDPIFSAVTNNYHRVRTFVITVEIPESSVTDTFSVSGATSTVKSVMWTNGASSTTDENAGTISLGILSTDPDGEPPSVTVTSGTWLTNASVSSYSGGSGTVTATKSANNLTDERDAVLQLQSSLDSATSNHTLTQDAADQVVATAATWTDNPSSKESPFEVDSSGGAGSRQFSFTTTPLTGLVTTTVQNLTSGSGVTVGTVDNANNRITVNYGSNSLDTFNIQLHPQGDTDTILDTIYISVMSGA